MTLIVGWFVFTFFFCWLNIYLLLFAFVSVLSCSILIADPCCRSFVGYIPISMFVKLAGSLVASRWKLLSSAARNIPHVACTYLLVTSNFLTELHIYIYLLYYNYIYIYVYNVTSSTAQGGGGSFKNRKPIGKVGCCESGMAERIHWWIERWLMSPLFLSLSLTIYLPTYLSSMYLSIYLSLSLSSVYLSSCLPVYLSIYLSICLSICLPVYLWCSVIECNVV